jgi:lambda repressor-like predicted transcriptional regulator
MADVLGKTERKQRLREQHKAWLEGIVRQDGRSLTALAREVGLDQSALTRFMNDDARGAVLDTMTIALIIEATGAPAPFADLGTRQPASRKGLRESEAESYVPTPMEIAAVAQGDEHLAWFVLRSRALEYEGYLPGDKMIVDLNRPARAGDIVCAQFYNWAVPGETQTVFRIYEPPSLLVAGPVEGERRARLVDGDNVIIKGVLRRMVRELR